MNRNGAASKVGERRPLPADISLENRCCTSFLFVTPARLGHGGSGRRSVGALESLDLCRSERFEHAPQQVGMQTNNLHCFELLS